MTKQKSRRLVIAAVCAGALGFALGGKDDKDDKDAPHRSARSGDAALRDQVRATLVTLEQTAYPRWVTAHPDRACPASLEELMPFAPGLRVTDLWEHRYHFACNGPDPKIAQLWVQSAGPDRRFGNADDVWSTRR